MIDTRKKTSVKSSRRKRSEIRVIRNSKTGRFITLAEARKLSPVFKRLAEYDKAKAQ